jgi:UDP-N-acetylglucosamine--N-acetylmuramyl-(pentapeptide) pyrophosphoryl-undecaprenol N-acetylglucosamine transferase
MVAALRGVPTMLLEQNAVPGLTNRLLARHVRAAAVSFDAAARFFGSKAFVSGNPVRPEFLAARGRKESDHDDGIAKVLVFGGSQGAHAINMAMVEAASRLAADGGHLRITHQTGERDVELVRAAYRDARLGAAVEPFLHDMGRRLGQADLVVCRAGATTLAEITAAAKAAILIPLPTATDDHQRKNAEALMAAGAAAARFDRRPARGADPRARRRSGAPGPDGCRGRPARAAGRRAGHRRSGDAAGRDGAMKLARPC